MNILDENIPESQRQLLKGWKIRVRQVGQDIGRKGMKDREHLIPLLRSLARPRFFTRDLGFFDQRLCHRRYCIVCLAVGAAEAASFVRRYLRHPAFNTKSKCMGKVIRISETGIRVWTVGAIEAVQLDWKS
ncbi:MAG TPA: hypothetical protein VK395_33255 [Gemmataceae bacterium]|nr:hypothetical protein [Gemmataceae bacterium]